MDNPRIDQKALSKTLGDAYRRKVLNQELSLREFASHELVLQSRPSKVILELTENCNFKCIMCSQAFDPKYSRYSKELNMKLELFDKVAEAVFPDAYFVDLRGFGETVFMPEWPQILDRLERYPLINWHLVTNLGVSGERKDRIWERMVDLGFILGFSCDAANAATFEEIRRGSSFEKIERNLALITQRMAETKRGHLYFIVTVQRRNVGELPAIMEMARKYGVREVQFKIVRQFDGGTPHQECVQTEQQSELQAQIKKSLALALQHQIRLTINDQELRTGQSPTQVLQAAQIPLPIVGLNFPPPEEPDPDFAKAHPWSPIESAIEDTLKVAKNKRCFKPYYYVYISRDGRVGTCSHMMNPEILEMGNLKHQSFEDIWNGDDYTVFRDSLSNSNPMDLRCQWCFKHRLED